jgi:hypothetical protein
LKKKPILKEASVLIIGILLMCTSVAGIATTTMGSIGNLNCETTITQHKISSGQIQDDIFLWDNFVDTWKTGYHAQDDPPGEPEQWDSFVADDFMFEEETEVRWIFWQNVYGFSFPPKDYHYDFNITFYEDDGTGTCPGAIYVGPITIPDEDIEKSHCYVNQTFPSSLWACGLSAYLPEPVTFDAFTKYWLSIYSIGPILPQTYFPVHNESVGGIKLHQAKFLSEHWGYPVWTNFSEVDSDGEQLDGNFILGGNDPVAITIKCGLGLTLSMTNMLSEEFIAHNVTVNITTDGGFVFNPIKNVLIPEFKGQQTETIRFYPLGLGKITIDCVMCCDENGIASPEIEGRLFLIFLLED